MTKAELKILFKKWHNKEYSLKEVYYYLQGSYRLWALHNKPYLIRKHIKEQIEWRQEIMKEECLKSGACVKCTCTTPDLQGANKPCDNYCCMRMKSRDEWKRFKKAISITDIKNSKINEYIREHNNKRPTGLFYP